MIAPATNALHGDSAKLSPPSIVALTCAFVLLAFAGCQSPALHPPRAVDWLIDASPYRATLRVTSSELVLSNGLVRRVFSRLPTLACTAIDDLVSGTSHLRAIEAEALLVLDGATVRVGGRVGQANRACPRPGWATNLAGDPEALVCTHFEEHPVEAPFAWKRVRHCEDRPWPAPGVHLVLTFEAPTTRPDLTGLVVRVHHQVHDGLPLFSKWIEVENRGVARTLDHFESERLAVVEAASSVEANPTWPQHALHVFSDYAMHARERGVQWRSDKAFTTQVNYRLETPCLVVARPEVGPGEVLEEGSVLRSHTVHVLVRDSLERERSSLALRRAMRTLAPWITENPLIFHARSSKPEDVRKAIDQAAATGFELVILSFGSGFDFESRDAAYAATVRDLVAYAHAKGIELGGYSLLASRRISDTDDVIDPASGSTGKHAVFGNSPCLLSAWGEAYFAQLERFRAATDLDALEHDGSYPGDVCASTKHPGHDSLHDSQWKQWKRITDYYARCRAEGVYLNVPDNYHLNGSNKTGMGYRETNWSLPRAEQLVHARQNIFDGTWDKTPTMGWMFVPLSEYHGGGATATIEPLAEHLDTYEAFLQINLGAGVQACWRGPRLYDSEATLALVKKWVDWFQARRAILESDVIHLRRADGRDWDGLLHVNPGLEMKGLAVLFNPLASSIERRIRLPLYYTGLSSSARVRVGDGPEREAQLDRGDGLTLTLTLPPGFTWIELR